MHKVEDDSQNKHNDFEYDMYHLSFVSFFSSFGGAILLMTETPF